MARQLTVMQILPALESGGVERGTLEVAGALARAGHRSLVVSAGGRLVDRLLADGSEHIYLPVGRKSLTTLLQVRRLRHILQQERVDILHARSRLPAWVAWMAWRGMPAEGRPRFVTTVHGLYSVNRYSAIMTRGERVIAVSDTARQYILDNYPAVDSGRVVTIYRGVDPAEFPRGYRPDESWLAAWYGDYPFLQGRRILTLPARLTRLKGHEEFIRLIGALVDGADSNWTNSDFLSVGYRGTGALTIQNGGVFSNAMVAFDVGVNSNGFGTFTIESNGQPGEIFHPNTVFVSKSHAANHQSEHFVSI